MDESGLKALLARGNVVAVRANNVFRDVDRKQSKYRAQPTELQGQHFHSKKEAGRWQTLRALELAGKIAELARQTRFSLDVNGIHICDYIADFHYQEDGKLAVEDVKGYRKGTAFAIFKLKASLMLACHGITVREI